MSSSPSADLEYLICIISYAYVIITPPIHIAIGYAHKYFWLIYIWMDNQEACPVLSSLAARYVNMAGLVSILELGSVKDRPDVTSYSMNSMRALGKSDVLRMRRFAKTVLALAFDMHGIQSVISPPSPALETTIGLDPALLSMERNSSKHSKEWVLSTTTYVKMASLILVPFVVYMMYSGTKRFLHSLCLCSASDAKQEPDQFLADGEWTIGQALSAADENGQEPEDKDAAETPDDTRNDADPNSIAKSANFLSAKLGSVLAAVSTSLPTVPRLFAIPFATHISNALRRTSKTLNSAIQKSSNCIVDALAPLVFGSLLLLTTATGILLYGVGRVGIAKIAQSGIFGLNEDAIDTLLEMIHMQWRLMRQLKWSWWFSVAGRYESCCQYSLRQKHQEKDGEPEHGQERIRDCHICTDPACPFRQFIPHNSASRPGLTPGMSDQGAGVKGPETKEKEAKVEAEAKTKASDGRGHHESSRGGHAHLGLPKGHIKLETRRDWLRWLILGRDGNGSHYHDRHRRHNVGNDTHEGGKERTQSPKDAKTDKSPTKDATARNNSDAGRGDSE